MSVITCLGGSLIWKNQKIFGRQEILCRNPHSTHGSCCHKQVALPLLPQMVVIQWESRKDLLIEQTKHLNHLKCDLGICEYYTAQILSQIFSHHPPYLFQKWAVQVRKEERLITSQELLLESWADLIFVTLK